MNSSTLHPFTLKNQGRQEVSRNMKGIAFTNLLHNVIREYGKYDGCDYSVNLDDIALCDRKLLLSYVLEWIEDYEEMINSVNAEMLINSSFKENSKYIQKLIDAECGEVYREDMHDMGMICREHPDNGERYWINR